MKKITTICLTFVILLFCYAVASDGSFGTTDWTGLSAQSNSGYIDFIDGTFTGTTGATLDSIEFGATYTGTCIVVVGLYTDSINGPKTRLCYGSDTYTSANNGTNAISSFTGTTTLTNGAKYWIAVGGDNGWNPYIATGQPDTTDYFCNYSNPAPSDAPSATGYQSYTWEDAIRAYYTNPGGGSGEIQMRRRLLLGR